MADALPRRETNEQQGKMEAGYLEETESLREMNISLYGNTFLVRRGKKSKDNNTLNELIH